nr:hypothetical protein CFP56_78967 [Quercus suber]
MRMPKKVVDRILRFLCELRLKGSSELIMALTRESGSGLEGLMARMLLEIYIVDVRPDPGLGQISTTVFLFSSHTPIN